MYFIGNFFKSNVTHKKGFHEKKKVPKSPDLELKFPEISIF